MQPADSVGRRQPGDAPLNVVLVEPQIPPNTGNGFSIEDRQLKRAGLDYWNAVDVRLHRSLEAFLAAWSAPFWLLSTRAARPYSSAAFAYGDALLFGKETAGLPQSLLDAYPERALRVPMRAGAVRSLNLSTSAGIVTYAALAHIGFPGLR